MGWLDTKLIVVPTKNNDQVFKNCFEIDDLPKEQFHEVNKLLARSQKLKNREHLCLNSKEASESVNSLEVAPLKKPESESVNSLEVAPPKMPNSKDRAIVIQVKKLA